jgi:magnesium-transporting ATPase (P-type)
MMPQAAAPTREKVDPTASVAAAGLQSEEAGLRLARIGPKVSFVQGIHRQHFGAELFRAGWFIESLATQTLVIFVIRTAGNPFKSRPSVPLLASVAGGVALGLLVVLLPIGGAIGFAPLPPLFFGVLMLFVVTYLGLVQLFKQRFYAASGWHAD